MLYKQVRSRLGHENSCITAITQKAKSNPKQWYLLEANHLTKMFKAAPIFSDEGLCEPILLGSRKKIEQILAEE